MILQAKGLSFVFNLSRAGVRIRSREESADVFVNVQRRSPKILVLLRLIKAGMVSASKLKGTHAEFF